MWTYGEKPCFLSCDPIAHEKIWEACMAKKKLFEDIFRHANSITSNPSLGSHPSSECFQLVVWILSIACCFSFLNMMNFRIRASSEGPIYVGRRLNDDLLVGVFRSGDQVVDLTLLELRMCFSTLKIIVSFGQLKSVEIVGTQIIFTCCQPPATNLPPIFHQSSTNLPPIFHQSSRMSHPFRIGFENSAANRPRRWCITSPALPALGAKSLLLHMERTGKNQEKHRKNDHRIRLQNEFHHLRISQISISEKNRRSTIWSSKETGLGTGPGSGE